MLTSIWKSTIFIRFACRNYRAQKSCNTTNLLQNYSLSKQAQFQENWIIFGGKQNQSVLQRWVSQSVKRIVILTMCHISEFQNILDSNYIRIGLSIYVKFTLGKWLGTRQKNYLNHTQNQNHASSRMRDQKYYPCIYNQITSIRNISTT